MPLAIIILLFALLIWTSMILDIVRLQNYFKTIGGKILTKRWNPFMGTKEREYLIRYEDKEGHIQEVIVRTSLINGTYILLDK